MTEQPTKGGVVLSDADLETIAHLAGVSRATVHRVLVLRAAAADRALRADADRDRPLSEDMKRLLEHAIRASAMAREVVYFIQAEQRGQIKIGTTRHLEKRLRVLRAGSPVRLDVVATIRGGRPIEQMLHIAFRALRRGRTEWFEPGKSLLSYLRQLRSAATPSTPAGREGKAEATPAAGGEGTRQ